MRAGDVELLQVVAAWALTLPFVTAVIVIDERRLRGDALARAWPAPSRDAAIFAVWLGLPPLCVLVHFARTRRSLGGLGLGLIWLFATVAVEVGAQVGVAEAVAWLGV